MKWKSFAVYVLCCFLLCNSVLADFEAIADNNGVDSGNDSGVSDVSDSSVSALTEGNDYGSLSEKVDKVANILSSLVDTSTSPDSSVQDGTEVSPGGDTVYLVGDLSNGGASSANPVLTDTVVATGLAPVTPSDASGVKAVLLSFIGDYDPPVVQYEYTTNNNYKQYVNEIQPDYVWICSFALIALFIYCLFKLGGGLLRG